MGPWKKQGKNYLSHFILHLKAVKRGKCVCVCRREQNKRKSLYIGWHGVQNPGKGPDFKHQRYFVMLKYPKSCESVLNGRLSCEDETPLSPSVSALESRVIVSAGGQAEQAVPEERDHHMRALSPLFENISRFQQEILVSNVSSPSSNSLCCYAVNKRTTFYSSLVL